VSSFATSSNAITDSFPFNNIFQNKLLSDIGRNLFPLSCGLMQRSSMWPMSWPNATKELLFELDDGCIE
jgi:hypothetical protein